MARIPSVVGHAGGPVRRRGPGLRARRALHGQGWGPGVLGGVQRLHKAEGPIRRAAGIPRHHATPLCALPAQIAVPWLSHPTSALTPAPVARQRFSPPTATTAVSSTASSPSRCVPPRRGPSIPTMYHSLCGCVRCGARRTCRARSSRCGRWRSCTSPCARRATTTCSSSACAARMVRMRGSLPGRLAPPLTCVGPRPRQGPQPAVRGVGVLPGDRGRGAVRQPVRGSSPG